MQNNNESTKKLRAATYNRVSPTREIEDETGIHKALAEAKRMCRAAAEADGLDVVFEFSDMYVSGKDNTAMSQFQAMLTAARAHEFDILFVKKVSRMGRNRKQTNLAIAELDCQLGIPIVFVENKIDTRTAPGRIFIKMLEEYAEQEREIIRENTSRGIKEALAKGVKFGREPKEVDVKKLRAMRLLPVVDRPTWSECEKTFDCGRSTLIKKLKQAGYWSEQRRTVI